MNKKYFLLLILGISLIMPPRAYAYLDAGTGSYLFQILLAFIFGVGVSIKMFWHNICAFFCRKQINLDEEDNN